MKLCTHTGRNVLVGLAAAGLLLGGCSGGRTSTHVGISYSTGYYWPYDHWHDDDIFIVPPPPARSAATGSPDCAGAGAPHPAARTSHSAPRAATDAARSTALNERHQARAMRLPDVDGGRRATCTDDAS